MDFTDTNFLDNLLNFFYEHSVTGMIQLQPHAFELVCVLAIIYILLYLQDLILWAI